MCVLAMHGGTPGREGVASRSEAAEDSHDVRVLQRSREEAVRRGTLGHGDTHTRPVDAVRNGLPGRAT